jgi:hypothetical protein
VILFLETGCWRKTDVIDCEEPMTVIDKNCCLDTDDNNICDVNETGVGEPGFIGCGDNACAEDENCTTCWKDCGACKKIVYIYVPRNFTLAEITYDINDQTRDGVKFRKDITALNDVANFFFFNKAVPRYFAEFMDVKYRFLYYSKWMVLNHIINELYYVNDSDSLLNYVNYTNWYMVHGINNKEKVEYEERISTGEALDDYPTQPTGYQKEFRYEDWEFRNYTKKENIVSEGVTILDNGMVESIHASITEYNITYKFHEYHDIDYETSEEVLLEDFRVVNEKRLANIHTISFICARNLAITLYEYEYDTDYYDGIKQEYLLEQIDRTRADLTAKAGRIKAICDKKYARKVFIYN